jgi:hypothetical protein
MALAILADLTAAQLRLENDLNANSSEKEIVTRTGHIRYQEYHPALSKPIVDEIDRVLARHYGFTDEELDFIINYDIKYRMGAGADGAE